MLNRAVTRKAAPMFGILPYALRATCSRLNLASMLICDVRHPVCHPAGSDTIADGA